MATTITYECRDCDRRVEEPLSNYTSHPNSWVYTDFRCESCSEIASGKRLPELFDIECPK